MSGYIIDPRIVREFLQKPYDLREIWQKVAGVQNLPPEALRHYTMDEVAMVETELDQMYAAQTANCLKLSKGRKEFSLSAGGPGAGKSTLLEQMLVNDPSLRNVVFSDPDERALKMMKAYNDDIAQGGGSKLALAMSYAKWRWASNYISNSIMNRACADGYDVLLGTTATSPAVSILYDNAKREEYHVRTIIVTASDDVRTESARRRFEDEGTRYTADTVEKGKMFYQRMPTFFEKSDAFSFYWRNAADQSAVLVAEASEGAVQIYDHAALRTIDADMKKADPQLTWKALTRTYQNRF